MKRYLLVLCGYPASGKTTFARSLHRRLTGHVDIEIVSTDDLRDDEYYQNFRPEREREVRIESLRRVGQLLRSGKSVIHDDTNYYASMRHSLLEIARAESVGFGIIHISTPLQVALEWNRLREGPVPDHVIEKIARRFDYPGSRYLWDLPLVEIDLSKRSVDDAVELVIVEFDNLTIPSSVQKEVDPKTTIDDLDVVTRRTIASYLKDHPEKRGSPEVSIVRRDILRQARRRNLSIEETVALLRARLDAI